MNCTIVMSPDTHPPGYAACDISVRRIGRDEWSMFKRIRLRSLESDPLAFGSTLETELSYEDTIWTERTERYATSRMDCLWIACSGDRPIGLAGLFFHGAVFHLFGLWVEPEFRGKHISSRLLDAAISWAKSCANPTDILLGVNPVQTAALELYRSRGFVPTGNVEELHHTPGQAVVEMRLAITRGSNTAGKVNGAGERNHGTQES